MLSTIFAVFSQQEYYFKFKIDEKEELEDITRMVSIDNVEGKTVYAYANEQQLEKFKQEKTYALRMMEHPRLKAKTVDMAKTVEGMSNWDKYPTYEVYVQMMNDFADDYPGIASLQNIGTTVDGRDLLVLKISDNVNQQEDEPELFYSSTMHGDETASFIFMLRFIDSLLIHYEVDSEITDYVNNIEIYINPNANPDGTYSGGNSTVSGATRSNANGVDLNRNFPDPAAGPHPDGNGWQPETKAMMDFAGQHNFTLSANFHGGAEVANYPWDTWNREHVDDAWMQHVSHIYADPAIANSPSGYFTGPSPDGIINGYDWYTITGGRQDFMNYFHQCREITMEVSSQKLLSTNDLRDYWNYNRQSLFDYMEQSLYGIRGIVTDENGEPLEAMVEIEGHDSDLDSSMVFTDPDVGDYHRMIEAGTYNVIFSAYGYFADTVENVTISYDDSIRVNGSLKQLPPTLNFSPDTLEIFIDANSTQTETLELVNSGSDTVDYILSIEEAASNPWIDIPTDSGSLESMQTESVDVKITSGAEDSVFTCNILLSHNGNMNKKDEVHRKNSYDRIDTIPVILNVRRNTSLRNNDLTDLIHLNFYPNPFNNRLIVVLNLEKTQQELNVSILNSHGQVVYSQSINNLSSGKHKFKFNFEAENISGTGLFYLRIENETGVIMKKLLRLK